MEQDRRKEYNFILLWESFLPGLLEKLLDVHFFNIASSVYDQAAGK